MHRLHPVLRRAQDTSRNKNTKSESGTGHKRQKQRPKELKRRDCVRKKRCGKSFGRKTK
jgi:hypothetical protein